MKRTINHLLIIMLVSLGACQNGENIDLSEKQLDTETSTDLETNPTPQSRHIYPKGVNVWRAAYRQLIKDSDLDSSATGNVIQFDRSQLTAFMGDTSENNIVDFHIYLDNKVPKFAIAKGNDETQFLIDDSGTGKIVPYSELKPKIDEWNKFIKSVDSVIVYVQKYSYTWANVFKVMDSETREANRFTLETVAHTVETHNPWFQVPKRTDSSGVQMEGYIAIDVLISGTYFADMFVTKSNASEKSYNYDFAMPCPKACIKKATP